MLVVAPDANRARAVASFITSMGTMPRSNRRPLTSHFFFLRSKGCRKQPRIGRCFAQPCERDREHVGADERAASGKHLEQDRAERVHVARWAEHRVVARGLAPVRVAGGVRSAAVGLDLDDAARAAHP